MKHLELYEKQFSSPKAFWKFIKSLGNPPSLDVPSSVESNSGEIVSEPSAVKEVWKKYFEKLLNPRAASVATTECKHVPSPIVHSELDLEYLNGKICLEEVQAAVKANRDSKSPGIECRTHGLNLLLDQSLSLAINPFAHQNTGAFRYNCSCRKHIVE